MASYYPHKQTVLITLLCIIAVGGALIYSGTIDISQKIPQKQAQIAPIDVQPKEVVADTVPSDWRKSFINNSSPTTALPAKKSATNEALTVTDQFGRDFFARYVRLKQDNLLDNQQLVQSVVDQSIDTAVKNSGQSITYALKDISITNDADSTSLKAYGNAIGLIFATKGVDGDPATIANTAFDKGDMTLLTGIDPMIGSYRKITADLLILPVPQPLATYHLSLVNSVSTMTGIAQDLRVVDKDPMRGMVALSIYSPTQSSIVGSLKSMQNYFTTSQISFSPAEPGALFSLKF